MIYFLSLGSVEQGSSKDEAQGHIKWNKLWVSETQ